MKKINLLLILCLATPLFIFAQGKIAKITNEHWNEQENRWQFVQTQTWDYDENQTGKEILFTHRDSVISVYTPLNNERKESFYDAQGNLIQQKIRAWGDTQHQETDINYSYNAQNQLIEKLTKNTYADFEEIYYSKEVYVQDEQENRRSHIYFRAINTPDNFVISHRRDSFFNANGCLLKHTILNYAETGEVNNIRWWTSTFAEGDDCQTLTSSQWKRYEIGSDSMIIYRQNIYEYSNDDKTIVRTHRQYDKSTDLWETRYLETIEYDDDERIIRSLWEHYKHSYIDTLLEIYTYMPVGEIDTYQRFETPNSHDDRALRLVYSDKFEYTFFDEAKLLSKKRFSQVYDNPIREFIDEYEYYCNGQLKRETTSEIGQYINRMTYEYHGNASCDLAERLSPEIKISPNPSNGIISLSSNLLNTENALIQVFNMIGQEVYREKINRVSEGLVLELSNLASGQYILTIRNENEMISEVFFVH